MRLYLLTALEHRNLLVTRYEKLLFLLNKIIGPTIMEVASLDSVRHTEPNETPLVEKKSLKHHKKTPTTTTTTFVSSS